MLSALGAGRCIYLIKNGATSGYNSYDNVTFFNNAHPVNPYDASAGTYANVFTGAAASTPSTDPNDANYPGACPIDSSVTTDVALVNLAKVITYIKGLKMPNGTTPRFLNPTKIIAGPKLQQRAVQLTSASTIAQAAASGGGGADVAAVIASYGWQKPEIADELSGFESDTTYFIACEELAASELGALVYVEREPFAINYYTTQQEVDLSRKNELEWHCLGRNVAGYGHPYLLFKVKAS
jgi:phage major head subunit gpT-like protein